MTQAIITKARTQKVNPAPGLVLNRSVSRDDPTQHHQSRYPKSRLFEYLPDLPSVSTIDPFLAMTQPSITRADTQKVDFSSTSQIYHRTSKSCCPGTLYRRGPRAGQTAKVGSNRTSALAQAP